MSAESKNYQHYVEHPRFGRAPRVTGLNPQPGDRGVKLHWNTLILQIDQRAIPNTAIMAETARQALSPIAVTHYYDLDTTCRDCGRRFIFFAEEQKFWYEELQLPLEADAVRCWECRREQRLLAKEKKRYDEVCLVENRTVDQTFEMAACCLSLIENGVFPSGQIQHVRQLLNSIRDQAQFAQQFMDLESRAAAAECQSQVRR
jgi:Probable zinc-ribbon domain